MDDRRRMTWCGTAGAKSINLAGRHPFFGKELHDENDLELEDDHGPGAARPDCRDHDPGGLSQGPRPVPAGGRREARPYRMDHRDRRGRTRPPRGVSPPPPPPPWAP